MLKSRLAPVLALSAGAGLATCLPLAACTGPDGPQGPMGNSGANGAQGTAGPSGSAGPAGPAGSNGTVDGGALPASCLSPCHGFNGVVEQWKTSNHYLASITDISFAEGEWTDNSAPCGNCHALDSIEQRVAGNVTTADNGTVTNLSKGEINYRDPASLKTSLPSYAGSAHTAYTDCTTCHEVTDQNDPHKTGQPWSPGSFPLRVPTGASDFPYLEKSPDTSAVAGLPATVPLVDAGTQGYGTANTCFWCHKSLEDVTNYISASGTVLTSPYWGPHEGPQADLFSAHGGYEYSTQTYGTSTHQLKLTCVDCHMPDRSDNEGVADHSFYAQLSACQTCHTGATSFDMGGGQSLVASAMFELEGALNTAGFITRSQPNGLTGSELGDGQFALDRARPGNGPDGGATAVSADQAGAVYNYFLIGRGGALGVHNPLYIKQLLFDSYVSIANTPPASIPVRPQ